jgi:peptide-methionine (R)-S-oxide reductase
MNMRNAMRVWSGVGAALFLVAAYALSQQVVPAHTALAGGGTNSTGNSMSNKVTKSEADWKKQLTPEQYHVLREKGTEQPFTGKYWNSQMPGVYKCAACGAVLFNSDAKFDSGCGWPSFDRPANSNAVVEAADHSLFMERTEVLCPICGGHLGHVFDDGPKNTTGMRYCINSASLTFEPATNSPAKK